MRSDIENNDQEMFYHYLTIGNAHVLCERLSRNMSLLSPFQGRKLISLR